MVVCINFIHCYSVITLFSLPGFQMNLVDWFKGMVAGRRGEELVDPLIEVQPSPRALKRALLVCLRCIDLDANKRPKMGQIVHMLEADEFPFRAVSPLTLILVFYVSITVRMFIMLVSMIVTGWWIRVRFTFICLCYYLLYHIWKNLMYTTRSSGCWI